jgi:hypothetical protein
MEGILMQAPKPTTPPTPEPEVDRGLLDTIMLARSEGCNLLLLFRPFEDTGKALVVYRVDTKPLPPECLPIVNRLLQGVDDLPE